MLYSTFRAQVFEYAQRAEQEARPHVVCALGATSTATTVVLAPTETHRKVTYNAPHVAILSSAQPDLTQREHLLLFAGSETHPQGHPDEVTAVALEQNREPFWGPAPANTVAHLTTGKDGPFTQPHTIAYIDQHPEAGLLVDTIPGYTDAMSQAWFTE